MAFDPETKLSDVLASGYHLNAKLQSLLGRPLDSRGQEEAMSVSQELSRVFMVSMSMLKFDNSDRLARVNMAPDIRMGMGDSFGGSTLAKRKRISREDVAPHKSSREEEFTRKEITALPHEDGYKWIKYGQKNIKNCSFERYYFKCHRDRRCAAKKKVQRQDGSSDPPMYAVTYENDHTCHVQLANDDAARKTSPTTTSHALKVADSARNGALFDLFHHIGGGGGRADENEAIVSCLATVISGTAPSSPQLAAEPGPISDPAAYVPQLQPAVEHSPSLDYWSMAVDTAGGFSFCPAEAAELTDLCDVHMDVARFMDTVWPQYYT